MFKRLVVATATLTLLGIFGCPSPDTVPDEPLTEQTAEDERTIVLYQYRFNPSSLEIEEGTTIFFENRDPETHNVNIPALNINQDVEPNQRWSHTFETRGEFAVSSRITEGMRLDLTVE